MKRIIILILLVFSFLRVFPQVVVSTSDTLRKNALNIFMNASDYLRKEIRYVNYVRHIKDAGFIYFQQLSEQVQADKSSPISWLDKTRMQE
jgi:hypothetical protein